MKLLSFNITLNTWRFVFLLLTTFLVVSSAWAESYDDLFRAVRLNDVGTVRTLLQKGMDPDTSDQEGNTILMTAIREDSKEVAQ